MTTNNFALLTGQQTEHLDWLNERIAVHKTVKKPWLAMQQAAKKAGYSLAIASGFRSFERQLLIWNKKFTQQLPVKDKHNKRVDLSQLSDQQKVVAILLYSALPGASRHHWGTDLDLYAPDLLPPKQQLQLESWEYQAKGYFYELSLWLNENAAHFGFYKPYDVYRGGVAVEPWHFSYAPLSCLYQQQLTPHLLYQAISHSNIQGKAIILKELTKLYQHYIINVTDAPLNTTDINFG
jgi:LAS superfamily LD-carboxypeptidase LdcB